VAHLPLPSTARKDNVVKDVNLGMINSSMAPSMIDVILRRLITDDEIIPGVGPNKLVKYWAVGHGSLEHQSSPGRVLLVARSASPARPKQPPSHYRGRSGPRHLGVCGERREGVL